jgi:hypothetical protein
MADPDKHTDIDKLLAEVERTLGEKPATPQPRASRAPAERERAGLAARVSTAALAGAVAAAVIWVAFFFLPFLGATSGAAGAFLATFVTLLVVRRR